MARYPGCSEIEKGIFIDEDDPAVYIADEKGEIVMWDHDEMKTDPGAWMASLSAVAMAAKDGPTAVREFLALPYED